MRRVLLWVPLLSDFLIAPANAAPIFEFGFSPVITLVPNTEVLLPAVLINRGSEPLNFDELDFGAGASSGPDDALGLGPLNLFESLHSIFLINGLG